MNDVDVFLDIMTMASLMCSLDKLTPEVAQFGNLLLARMLDYPSLIPVPRRNGQHVVEVVDLPEIEIEQWTLSERD